MQLAKIMCLGRNNELKEIITSCDRNKCNILKYIVKSGKCEMEALLLVVSDLYTLLYT